MKILHYLLGASMLIAGIDLIVSTSTGSLYACPRCRRALPKGPRKLPHPGFPNSNRHNKPASLPPVSPSVAKETVAKLPDSCAGSCCCIQQKMPAPRVSQNKYEEIFNEQK